MNVILGVSLSLAAVCVRSQEPDNGAKPATIKQKKASPTLLTLADHFRKSANPHISPYAYVLSASIWQSRKIYVCWDNPSSDDQTDMAEVRKAIEETWEKYSGLTFVGWGQCAQKNRGIRITIVDSGARTLGLGRQLDTGSPGGMLLNFTFKQWSPNCQDAKLRITCIRSIAIHEFGHAIGFSHEQNRPDKPGECVAAKQGPDGDKLLTPYDPQSVMNYCFNIYNPDLQLSKLDIAAVRYLYGSEEEKLAQPLTKGR